MITAVHIEDEPRNVALLQNLIKTHCGDTVKLYGNAGNINDALALIKSVRPQLVYLDIELNQGNAFELLEKLNEENEFTFQVIFITAFSEYAIKAFKFNAVDYLLKPISIEELKAATTKAANKINDLSGNGYILEALRQLKVNYAVHKIGIPVPEGLIFVNTDEIIRAEAVGSYSSLYLLNGQKITSTKNLKDMETILPTSTFLRVHHSWIINTKYLKKYYRGKNSYIEMEDGSTVAVSLRKKGLLLDFLS